MTVQNCNGKKRKLAGIINLQVSVFEVVSSIHKKVANVITGQKRKQNSRSDVTHRNLHCRSDTRTAT